MATAPKLEDLQDKDTAEAEAARIAAIDAAAHATTTRTSTQRDRDTARARQAELDRQDAIVAAVADADLSSLGGPLMEPGLGR